MFVVRPIAKEDTDAFMALADLSGPGFTSLPDDKALLENRVKLSLDSFSREVKEPGEEGYLLVLEDSNTGKVVGTSAVKVGVGLSKPFFNFRIFSITQSSAAAQRRFDMDVMILVNEFNGATEVGTLFVHPDARGGGTGGLIAQARYLLMAGAPSRFGTIVLAELRGVVDKDGYSPFWEYMTRQFFQMDFNEADFLSGTTDKQFILDLMPKYPIYADLLPEKARAVMGVTHPEGLGAKKMLEREGFVYNRVIDIFDGGPLVSAHRDNLRTMRQSRLLPVETGTVAHEKDALAWVSNNKIDGFRACSVPIHLTPDTVVINHDALDALQVKTGDHIRILEQNHA